MSGETLPSSLHTPSDRYQTVISRLQWGSGAILVISVVAFTVLLCLVRTHIIYIPAQQTIFITAASSCGTTFVIFLLTSCTNFLAIRKKKKRDEQARNVFKLINSILQNNPQAHTPISSDTIPSEEIRNLIGSSSSSDKTKSSSTQKLKKNKHTKFVSSSSDDDSYQSDEEAEGSSAPYNRARFEHHIITRRKSVDLARTQFAMQHENSLQRRNSLSPTLKKERSNVVFPPNIAPAPKSPSIHNSRQRKMLVEEDPTDSDHTNDSEESRIVPLEQLKETVKEPSVPQPDSINELSSAISSSFIDEEVKSDADNSKQKITNAKWQDESATEPEMSDDSAPSTKNIKSHDTSESDYSEEVEEKRPKEVEEKWSEKKLDQYNFLKDIVDDPFILTTKLISAFYSPTKSLFTIHNAKSLSQKQINNLNIIFREIPKTVLSLVPSLSKPSSMFSMLFAAFGFPGRLDSIVRRMIAAHNTNHREKITHLQKEVHLIFGACDFSHLKSALEKYTNNDLIEMLPGLLITQFNLWDPILKVTSLKFLKFLFKKCDEESLNKEIDQLKKANSEKKVLNLNRFLTRIFTKVQDEISDEEFEAWKKRLIPCMLTPEFKTNIYSGLRELANFLHLMQLLLNEKLNRNQRSRRIEEDFLWYESYDCISPDKVQLQKELFHYQSQLNANTKDKIAFIVLKHDDLRTYNQLRDDDETYCCLLGSQYDHGKLKYVKQEYFEKINASKGVQNLNKTYNVRLVAVSIDLNEANQLLKGFKKSERVLKYIPARPWTQGIIVKTVGGGSMQGTLKAAIHYAYQLSRKKNVPPSPSETKQINIFEKFIDSCDEDFLYFLCNALGKPDFRSYIKGVLCEELEKLVKKLHTLCSQDEVDYKAIVDIFFGFIEKTNKNFERSVTKNK